MLKKGMVVGVIFLLLLVSLPIVSSEQILYPKEEGPYKVIIIGPSNGMGGGIYTFFLHFWPLWFLPYPLNVDWHFDPGSVFFVNGEKQNITYPAQIELRGFKGYGPSFYMMVLKGYGEKFILILTGFLPTMRARVAGQCTEIMVSIPDNQTHGI